VNEEHCCLFGTATGRQWVSTAGERDSLGIGEERNGGFQAIGSHGETRCSFRGIRKIQFLYGERYSSEKLRWAVASDRKEKLHCAHPSFLTDRTGRDIDPADSQQLFLPCLVSDVFSCYGFIATEELAT